MREPPKWRQRLTVPAYQIKEAAKYARLSSQTVANWHDDKGSKRRSLSSRAPRSALSYMQLIEVAVVAAFRKAELTLKEIRNAREFMS